MESDNGVFKTLDLISLLDGSSEIQTRESNTESRKVSKKRKNNSSDSDHRPKKERRKETVFSKTMEMPTALKDLIAEMGGSDIQIVTQKKLQKSDTNKNHGRLLIPLKKLMNDFGRKEEKKILKQHNEKDPKNKNGIEVLIIDPVLRNRQIELKMWRVGKQDDYCLVSKWNSFVQENSLESGDYIQLWSFRSNTDAFMAAPVTSDLCFALVKLHISDGIFKFI